MSFISDNESDILNAAFIRSDNEVILTAKVFKENGNVIYPNINMLAFTCCTSDGSDDNYVLKEIHSTENASDEERQKCLHRIFHYIKAVLQKFHPEYEIKLVDPNAKIVY